MINERKNSWITSDIRTLTLLVGLLAFPSNALAEPSVTVEGCLFQDSVVSKKELCFTHDLNKSVSKVQLRICAGPNFSGGIAPGVKVMTAGVSVMICAVEEFEPKGFDEAKAVDKLTKLVRKSAEARSIPGNNWDFAKTVQSAGTCSNPKLDLFALLKQIEQEKAAKKLTCQTL